MHLLNDVVLSAEEELTAVDQKKLNGTYSGPIKAIILNHGDHAYAKVRFDDLTMKNLVQDGLSSYGGESLTRMHIWLNLWHQMLDQ